MAIEKLKRIKDVAPQIGIPEKVLWTMCRNNQFPHVRAGKRILISESSVQKWIEEQTAKVMKPAVASAATA